MDKIRHEYRVVFSLNKLLPFLQIKKSVENKNQGSNRKKNSIFHGDFLPDHFVKTVRDIKWVEENIPHGTIERRGYNKK